MKILYYLLQITWGCIQNLLGLTIWLILMIKNPSRKISSFYGAIVTEWKFTFSTGCGMFIFYGHKDAKDAKEVLVHEYGHTIQSCILGPLFMFVIALPSTMWAFIPIFIKLRKQRNIKYCDFYCEAWANHLGTLVTKLPAPDR